MSVQIDKEAQLCAQEMARKRDERLNSKQDSFDAKQEALLQVAHKIEEEAQEIKDEQARQARLYQAQYIQLCGHPLLDPRTRRPFPSLTSEIESEAVPAGRPSKKGKKKLRVSARPEASPPVPKEEGKPNS